MEEQFATAITCMDGRIQTFVNQWMMEKFDLPYVDVITEPGPNGILADKEETWTIANIKKRVGISVNKHGSKWVVLVGHEDCAGNPGSMGKQIADVKEGLNTLAEMDFDANLMGIWVDLQGTIDVIEERRCIQVEKSA